MQIGSVDFFVEEVSALIEKSLRRLIGEKPSPQTLDQELVSGRTKVKFPGDTVCSPFPTSNNRR
jgi:hypothetical protein